MDPFGEILRKLFRYKFDTDTYEKEALHRGSLVTYNKALYHDTRRLDDLDPSDSVAEEALADMTPFPVFKANGVTKCADHGLEYLMSGPCPSCAYEFGVKNSTTICEEHDVEHLKSSGCPVCAYSRGYEDAETALKSVVANGTPSREPNSEIDPDQDEYPSDAGASPPQLCAACFDLLEQTHEVGDGVSTELKSVSSWLRNEESGTVLNKGNAEFEPEEPREEHRADYYEDDDVDMIDVETIDYPGCPHSSLGPRGATLSQISSLKDQLAKLLADEKRITQSPDIDDANIQLYLMTSVQHNGNQPLLVGVDLTPFLTTGESFLYYTVGEPDFDQTPLPSPAELMAKSIRSDLQLLSKLDSKALSREGWASVRGLYDETSRIARPAVTNPPPQPVYIQELWKVWEEITVFFKIGVQNLGLIPGQDSNSNSAAGAMSENGRPGEPEKVVVSNTGITPEVTVPDEKQKAVDQPMTGSLPSPEIKVDVVSRGWEHDETALLRFDDHKRYDDLYLNSVWLSRFDSHLPQVCHQSQELDPMLASLIYAVTVMLRYEHNLPKPRKKYLNSIRTSGEDVVAGRNFYLANSLQKQGTSVWDICWKIYFDLTEHLVEEDENFLSQLFHVRTSACRYEDIRFPWIKYAMDDNDVDPESRPRDMEPARPAVEVPLLTGYDQTIEDAQMMFRERDRVSQLQQAINSNATPKRRRKNLIKRLEKEPSRTMYDQMIEDAQKAMREKDQLGKLQQQTDETDWDYNIT